MQRVQRLLILIALGLSAWSPAQAAQSVTVQQLRLWHEPDNLRLVMDVSDTPDYRLFTLQHPERVVIDLKQAHFRASLPKEFNQGVLSAIRVGAQGPDQGVRVVLDLRYKVEADSFVLKPYGPLGHRLVVDLKGAGSSKATAMTPVEELVKPPKPSRVPQDVVIAIDAGHGGEDPGATGRRYRTHEKDVVLAIARKLETLVRKAPGMRPVMIRDGDYAVALKNRYIKAREHRAQVFVSIHADAIPGKQARGSSVYALTERGASSRVAKFLADKENAADLIGGVNLEDKDPVLQKVLVDLSQTSTISESLELGRGVLAELKKVGPLHRRSVEQAGFAVLKAPDIPSILVETAFISNPAEEKNLRNKRYQQKVARAIFQGIQRFVKHKHIKPAAQQMVQTGSDRKPQPREHIVQRGDTLIGLANRYGTEVDALRFANNIRGSKLIIGRKLLIP